LPQKDNELVLDNAGKAMKRIIGVWHALIEETLKRGNILLNFQQNNMVV